MSSASVDESERTSAFYETHAAEYATVTREADLDAVLHQLRSRLPPGARILDLGCGAGRDARRLAAAGYDVVGLDYALSLLRFAAGESPASLVLGDMRELPFRHSSFAAVWAIASLLHVRKDSLVQVLQDVATVVQPGGYLFSSVKVGVGERTEDDGRFFSYYTATEWSRFLQRSGWVTLDLNTVSESRDANVVTWVSAVSQRQ